MVKIISVLCSSLFTCAIIAQEVNVKWTEETEIPTKNEVHDLFKGSDNSVYIVREKNYEGLESRYFKHYLSKYESDAFSFKFDVELELPKFKDIRVDYHSVTLVGKKIYVIGTCYDKDNNMNYCLASEVNQSTGSISSYIKIDESPSTIKGDPAYYYIRQSSDESKILVMTDPSFKKYANETYNVSVADENLKNIYKASFTLPYTDKSFRLSNYTLDKNGNLHMLASVQKESNEANTPNYYYTILQYDFKSKTVKEIKIDLSGKYISDITFRNNDKNNSLVIAGFYSNQYSNGITGVFYQEINKDSRKIIESSTKEFSQETLNNFLRKGEIRRGDEPDRISINYVSFDNDGSMIIAGEQTAHTQRCVTDSKTFRTKCTTTYRYKSILVSKVNSLGEFEWTTVVPKMQMQGVRWMFSSYYLTVSNGNVCILYNENPVNLEMSNPHDFKNFVIGPKGILALATIDSKGKLNRKPIQTDGNKAKTVFMPTFTMSQSNNDAILYSGWGKKMRFGKMIIK